MSAVVFALGFAIGVLFAFIVIAITHNDPGD